jgi:Mg-chelatase subunit ChlD
MVIVMMFLEFIYEFEPTPAKQVIIKEEKTLKQVEDFYFVIDDSGSLQNNDPKYIRKSVLINLIDEISEDKRISLISFGGMDFARILQKLSLADIKGKEEFRNHVSRFDSSGPTTDILTALGLNEKLIDKRTTRLAMVVMITDGENSDKGPDAPTVQYLVETYSNLKIPIFSIFLGSEYTDEAIAFLENISIPTGGKVILVEDMDNIQEELTRVVQTEQKVQPQNEPKLEPIRDMLEKRTGKRQNSFLYALMHIVFITLIGLLMGYLLYVVFSNITLYKPFLLGGGISGFLAGLILEFGLQTGFLPDFIIRLFACVILSTVIWVVYYIYKEVAVNKEPKVSKDAVSKDDIEQPEMVLENNEKKEQNNTGVLGI